MNIIDFRDAKATRDKPAPRRINKRELEALRFAAEINALRDGATKAERDLVDALVELQDRRAEETW
jgi:hypothetical protein